MSITDIPQDLLNKLNKLKNLEDGARSVGSFEEAENAASKFQDLLLKYNLDADEVLSAGLQKKIDMLGESVELNQFYAYRASDWAYKLIKVVAHYSLCQIIITSSSSKKDKISIVGERQNVAMALYIMEQLVEKIKVAFKISYKEYKGPENEKLFRRGFLTGAVTAINLKLSIQERKAKEEEMKRGGNSLALMVVDKRKKAHDYLKELFPHSKTINTKKVQLRSEDGFNKGVEAGRGIDINKGLTPTNNKRLN
jgi:hypothetical protein